MVPFNMLYENQLLKKGTFRVGQPQETNIVTTNDYFQLSGNLVIVFSFNRFIVWFKRNSCFNQSWIIYLIQSTVQNPEFHVYADQLTRIIFFFALIRFLSISEALASLLIAQKFNRIDESFIVIDYSLYLNLASCCFSNDSEMNANQWLPRNQSENLFSSSQQ